MDARTKLLFIISYCLIGIGIVVSLLILKSDIARNAETATKIIEAQRASCERTNDVRGSINDTRIALTKIVTTTLRNGTLSPAIEDTFRNELVYLRRPVELVDCELKFPEP